MKRDPGEPSTHSKHDLAGTISRKIAAERPVTSPGELIGRIKEVKGFQNKKELAKFVVGRHHTPWLQR